MTISEKCDRVSALLTKIKRYEAIVVGDTFGGDAMDEIKDNTKSIADEAKAELDLIKDEVDSW